MGGKIAAAALQYSKKLSQEITFFWILYRILVVVMSAIQPDIAPAIASTIAGVDTIMMINVGTYLVNSLGEKYIYSDRFVMSWIKTGGWRSLVSKIADITTDHADEDKAEPDEDVEEESEVL